MIQITDKSRCCGCEACVQVCPKHCISFKQDHEGFFYPEANADICIQCGLCEKVCPVLHPYDEQKPLEVLAAINKDEEVRIKAGVKVVGDKGPKNNTETPAFISLKYYPKNDYELDGFKSTATIVADKINLIGTHTTDPATKEIPVTENKDTDAEEKDNLISDSAMKELINKAHQIPYGDTLIEFLDILRTAFAKHVHPFPTMAPCNDDNMKAVAGYDLEGILSDNVRIN